MWKICGDQKKIWAISSKFLENNKTNILIGNGFCNDETNNVACMFDGLDCCGLDSVLRTDYCVDCVCHG